MPDNMAERDKKMAAMIRSQASEAAKLCAQVKAAAEDTKRRAEAARNFRPDMTQIQAAVASGDKARADVAKAMASVKK